MRYFLQDSKYYASKIPYGNNPNCSHSVKADDAIIYYEIYGEGEPILVLHGAMVGCPYELGQFIDLFSKHYLVISPSSRGHGKSEIGTKKMTYEQKANDMMAVVNEVTKEPFTILGFSDGGYVAYKIAAMFPDRVKKMITIGAGENIPGLRTIPSIKIADLQKQDPEFVKEKLELCPEPDKLQNYLDDFSNFLSNELISKNIFSKIQCPTLVMAGEVDTHAPLDTVINAYKMIPNAQLAIIANGPHTVFHTNFEAVWSNIRPFLNLPE